MLSIVGEMLGVVGEMLGAVQTHHLYSRVYL